MTVRTITLHVTGDFGTLTNEQVADTIFEVLGEDPYMGETGIWPVKGISLPSEEDEGLEFWRDVVDESLDFWRALQESKEH